MDQLVTILREQEAGPVHIEVDEEWEELGQLTGVDVETHIG